MWYPTTVCLFSDWEAVVKLSDDFNGADLRNVCTEAGKLFIQYLSAQGDSKYSKFYKNMLKIRILIISITVGESLVLAFAAWWRVGANDKISKSL